MQTSIWNDYGTESSNVTFYLRFFCLNIQLVFLSCFSTFNERFRLLMHEQYKSQHVLTVYTMSLHHWRTKAFIEYSDRFLVHKKVHIESWRSVVFHLDLCANLYTLFLYPNQYGAYLLIRHLLISHFFYIIQQLKRVVFLLLSQFMHSINILQINKRDAFEYFILWFVYWHEIEMFMTCNRIERSDLNK